MQNWIEKMKWEIVTGTIALIGFIQWIVYNLLKSQFPTKMECQKMQEKCNNLVCKDINELRGDLRAYRIDAEAKRDDARDKLADQLTQIKVFMARIDQKILDDRWGSNNENGA
jgi:hypothetical protein